MANNKVQLADGTVLVDLTDTTATASDVQSGKYFYTADGVKTVGTASGGTSAISVVDTTDSHGGTVRTITALDISDTTAVASDVAQGKYFYTADGTKTAGTASGGSTPSATQHTIYFEFSDSTDTTITAYYDSTFISDAILATTPTTYGGKTVDLAQLDNVTWYERPTETWETVYDGTIASYDNVATIPSLSDFYFAADEVYRVTFSNVEYLCSTEYYQPGDTYVIGNLDLLDNPSASGLPFLCYNVGWGALYISVQNGGTGVTYTFKLEKRVTS